MSTLHTYFGSSLGDHNHDNRLSRQHCYYDTKVSSYGCISICINWDTGTCDNHVTISVCIYVRSCCKATFTIIMYHNNHVPPIQTPATTSAHNVLGFLMKPLYITLYHVCSCCVIYVLCVYEFLLYSSVVNEINCMLAYEF